MKKTTTELINREVDRYTTKHNILKEKRDYLKNVRLIYPGKQEQEILDIVSNVFDDYINTVGDFKKILKAVLVNESTESVTDKE